MRDLASVNFLFLFTEIFHTPGYTHRIFLYSLGFPFWYKSFYALESHSFFELNRVPAPRKYDIFGLTEDGGAKVKPIKESFPSFFRIWQLVGLFHFEYDCHIFDVKSTILSNLMQVPPTFMRYAGSELRVKISAWRLKSKEKAKVCQIPRQAWN